MINETTVENDTENTDKFEKKSDDRQKSIKEDDEIEYYSYDEVVKKERNKWIFIAVASILITIGISASYMNIQKEKNEKLLRTEIEEAQKEAKENAEAIAKIEMEKKLAEETQKIKDHVEEEARKNAILNSVAQNQDVAKENQDKKVDSGIGIEIPKIDTKQIEELNKKAKETQKNIEDLIEKKDGIVGFYNEITTKFNAMLKSVESFFSNLIGDSETKDENICKMILEEFGLNPKNSRIINGHVPVKVRKGESPVKGNGKLFVIDGGFSKAYRKTTGIAGYTMIYNSKGIKLVSHAPFESLEKAVKEEEDIISSTVVIDRSEKMIKVKDTDIGKDMKRQIDELKKLLIAYRTGLIKPLDMG